MAAGLCPLSKWRNISGSVFYSLTKNTISLPNIFEGENESFFANNNQTHQLSLRTNYNWRNFDFGVRYNFRTGLPYSGPGQIDAVDDEDTYELIFENINNLMLNSYRRLDFSVEFKGRRYGVNYQLGCSFLNILGTRNIGSRKSILTNTRSSSSQPSVVEFTKNLLPRTFIFHSRIFL